ncbi:hypothetical protein JNUCC1_01015 [Lentibacillus sp. JNUCC-1]|uniref:GNAT family N-acetyltransferase n=1 Tax=Lentibacillus sp. JNUCC-1 TaxID=2654513 RepID=UPI00132512E5|nr:GNAT family N-acetyltransferase [Lentibacillus sp. JNUCC-1]MUV37209.1 hypothetical protein [Lentibacillus sp. JNUCC-1]
MEDIIELKESDYESVSLLSQFAFQYELSEDELIKKKKEMARHRIWGWMVEGDLAAKLHLIPLSCYILGNTYKMGGISAVGTWPEYRRQGMVKKLLKHALTEMKKEGQTISFLHPFSIPFYRKYGWEMAFHSNKYTIPMKKLKKDWDGKGYLRRNPLDLDTLHSVYTRYAKQFTGMLTRDRKWWEQRVFKDRWHTAVAYDEAGSAEGYLLYMVKENVLHVHEMVDCTLNARKLLFQFISDHDSMAEEVRITLPDNDHIRLLINDPSFQHKVEPNFMARIVDVLAFLEKYPLQKCYLTQPLLLHVVDDFLPENNGTYHFNSIGDHIKITYEAYDDISVKGLHCNIQQLTIMMLGYKRPSDLFNAGLLKGEYEDIKKLEKIIPFQQTLLTDSF